MCTWWLWPSLETEKEDLFGCGGVEFPLDFIVDVVDLDTEFMEEFGGIDFSGAAALGVGLPLSSSLKSSML